MKAKLRYSSILPKTTHSNSQPVRGRRLPLTDWYLNHWQGCPYLTLNCLGSSPRSNPDSSSLLMHILRGRKQLKYLGLSQRRPIRVSGSQFDSTSPGYCWYLESKPTDSSLLILCRSVSSYIAASWQEVISNATILCGHTN